MTTLDDAETALSGVRRRQINRDGIKSGFIQQPYGPVECGLFATCPCLRLSRLHHRATE